MVAGSRELGSPQPSADYEWCLGSHPGALSSCCVCASFFRAPHRCYENLRSPAGKVTSPCCLSPGPCLGPCGGWAGSLRPSQLLASPTCLFPSLPTLFLPNLLHPRAGSLVPSFIPCAPFSLLPERRLGESSNSGEGPGLIALPLMSLFPVNPGAP